MSIVGRYFKRPVWCPYGYIPVGQIGPRVCEWVEAGEVPDDDLTAVLLGDKHGTSAAQIAPVLTSGNLRTAGVFSATGQLILVSPADWRVGQWVGERFVYAPTLACEGREISASYFKGPPVACQPVVTERDLAILLRHKTPPPLPSEVPSEWQVVAEEAPTGTDLNETERLKLWMRGYAVAYKAACKAVTKRESAISAAMSDTRCSWRVAAAAYEDLPYPDLRNSPRKESS